MLGKSTGTALANLGETSRTHPFDVLANRAYRAHQRLLRIQLRLRQLPGAGAKSLRLPLPYAVKPPVVS